MIRLLRVLLFGAVALVMIAGAGGGGVYLWLRGGLPVKTGTLTAAGLAAPVEILRDAQGIPWIKASSELDLAFALGYAHAQDRLWQMEAMRRLASGRLAELVGPPALPSDRLMRTFGLVALAERQLAGLAPEVRRTLEAYASGVNAHLAARRGPLPPEFLVLGAGPPEPWRPTDSLLWGRLMGMTLVGNWREEILRARLAKTLSAAEIAALWPGDGGMTQVPLASVPADLLPAADRLDRLLAALPEATRSIGASNVWAVDGRWSATGRPLLANDPHLGFSAPNLWYLANLEAPGLRLVGATAPGVPFLVLGHNGTIAWGITSTQADTQDVFVERLTAGRPGHYDTPDGPRPFDRRSETIAIKGGRHEALTVRTTRHGPVVSDILGESAGAFEPGQTVLALASTVLAEDDRTPEALYRMNRARSWEEFDAALADFHCPVQNVMYAGRDGRIAFAVAGRVPRRASGDGFLPVPGWTGTHDWAGMIPPAELPVVVAPPSGRIVNANNRVSVAGNSAYLGRDFDLPYRARRVAERLSEAERHDVESFAAIQQDIVSRMAREVLPLMYDLPPALLSEPARTALALLRPWDGTMDRSRPEPLIFMAWMRAAQRAIFADRLGSAYGEWASVRSAALRRALSGDAPWCAGDPPAGSSPCGARLARALVEAVAELTQAHGPEIERWQWGAAHKAVFRNRVLSAIPLVGPWLADIRLSADGGWATVNRAAMALGDREMPYAAVHGAGYRAVYDLADLNRSLFIQATGQSGHPLSSHYRDLAPRWRDGEYLKIGAAPAVVARRLTLEPGP
jgi:penicillin amidase